MSLGPASRLLGVDPDTLRRWADDGRVESFVTPGGHRRFDRRELERVLAARRPGASSPPLASLGVTPDRMSQVYRRSYVDRPGPAAAARTAVPTEERDAYRADGRELVTMLVAYLDATSDEARTAAEGAAAGVAAELGRRLAAAGLSLTESVALFVAARRPFLEELGAMARRRALDSGRTSSLFEAASALLDRLLVRFIAAHQEVPS
jgi:excisionase family DNA binding protein